MSDGDDVFPWRETEREEVMRCPVFTVERRRMVESHPTSTKQGDFFVIRAPDWVNVVALTPDDELVVIEQWRHGVAQTTWEIPGGMVDPGESAATAAQRELLEETGYASDRWFRLGAVEPNPAIQNNRCATFVALNCRKVAAPSFDGNERIRGQTIRYSDAAKWVVDGRIQHALVVAALHWESLRRAGVLTPEPVNAEDQSQSANRS